LSKIQQTGAKFNFTDEVKEWLGDHPELWAWPSTLEANNDRQICAIIEASNYVEEGLVSLGILQAIHIGSKMPKLETVLASHFLPPESLPADKSAVGFCQPLLASPIRSIPYREQKLRLSVEPVGDEHCRC
jgi:hypothetical protein